MKNSLSIKSFFQDMGMKNQKCSWSNISYKYKIPEYLIEKYQYELNWNLISQGQTLSEEFIEKFKHCVVWVQISYFQKLSEEFIEKHKDYVYWRYIFSYQELSEAFIEKYCKSDRLYGMESIFENQNLSDKFIEAHKNKIGNNPNINTTNVFSSEGYDYYYSCIRQCLVYLMHLPVRDNRTDELLLELEDPNPDILPVTNNVEKFIKYRNSSGEHYR